MASPLGIDTKIQSFYYEYPINSYSYLINKTFFIRKSKLDPFRKKDPATGHNSALLDDMNI